MPWQPIDLIDDSDDPAYDGDPGDLLGFTLEDLLYRPAWHRHAACRGQLAAFYLERGDDPTTAKATCANCPVSDPCREASIGEKHGIWAGTSPMQRRVARRTAA